MTAITTTAPAKSELSADRTKELNVEPDAATSALAPWADFPLAEVKGGDILATRARKLAADFNIPLEAATLICCTAVSAATGGAYRLRGPGSIQTPPAINAIFVDSSVPLQLAMDEVFSFLKAFVRGSSLQHRRTGKAAAVAEEKEILGKFGEANRLAAQAKEIEEGGTSDAVCARARHKHVELQKRAEDLKCEAFEEFHLMESRRRPLFVASSVTADRIADARRLSVDGSIFVYDCDGVYWSSVASARPAKAKDYATVIASGWHGEPRLVGGEIRPAACLGSLSSLGTPLFARLLGCGAVGGHGLRRMLFVGGHGGTAVADDEEEEDDPETCAQAKFNQMLLGLLAARNAGLRAEVQMSKEARGVFMDFVGDVGHVESHTGFPAPDALRGATAHAQRFALLRHLGAGKKEDEELDEDTMRKACSLVAWGIRCAADAAEEVARAGAGGGDGDWDEEIQMAMKIRRKGKLTKRQLFRTYDVQRSDVLMPVLERAVDAGLVVKADDGTFEVPDGGGGR